MADNFYYILGETRMSGCLFWEALKIKEESDSVMVNLNKELCFTFRICCYFILMDIILHPGFHLGFVLSDNCIEL